MNLSICKHAFKFTCRDYCRFTLCVEDPSGILHEPLQYYELAWVFPQLKPEVTGVSIAYEHICFAGPNLWVLWHQLFQYFFDKFSVCGDLKSGVILPLLKGKGAKANNKDNFRGITFFLTFCKNIKLSFATDLKNMLLKCGSFLK